MGNIKLDGIAKRFRILKRREGLSGSIRDLFSRDYRIVKAVNGVSFEIYGIDRAAYERNLGIFDEIVNLKELYGTPVKNLSLGQRMLCDIAASFIHDPSIIFLDEPTIGLDVEIRAKVRAIIKELNRLKRATVLLSSHDVGDIESLARRIILIDKGRILYDGPTEGFNTIFGASRTLRLDVDGLDQGQIERLKAETARRAGAEQGVAFGEAANGWLGIDFDQDRVPLLDLLNPILAGYKIKDIKVEEIEMEEVIKRAYAGALG